MKAILFTLFLVDGGAFAQTVSPISTNTSGKHPFTFEDMMALQRVAEPVPSPDGKWILFAATDVKVEENMKKSHL